MEGVRRERQSDRRSEAPFFAGLQQVSVPWRDSTLMAPVFYYDVTTVAVHYLAPVSRVEALLPSPRMHPIRVTPGRCVVSLSVFEYRDCDIGPYNEFSVAIPIVLDFPSFPFTGILRAPPAEPWVYVRHLPVNTRLACDAGVEFGSFPKSLTDIELRREGDWIHARVGEQSAPMVELACRVGTAVDTARSRMHAINVQADRLLRCEAIFSERAVAETRRSGDVELTLGGGEMARELAALDLGRLLGCQVSPSHQAILTPAMESLPAAAGA